jgi:hypothetical protein
MRDELPAAVAARRPPHVTQPELARAIEQSDGDGPPVQAAVDHFHVAMGALQKETIAHVFEMRSVLTPAQAIAAGSSHLVIGRPITAAQDPALAFEAICRSLEVGPAG